MADLEPRHIYEICFDTNNNDKYYIGSHSDVAFGTDVWTAQTSGVAHTLHDAWYDPAAGYWIIVGDNGTILKTTDGETYNDYSVSAASPAITFSLRCVRKWGGYWWAVGYGDNSNQATILRSTDGENWSSIQISSPVVPSSLTEIGFSDGLMIFGGWTNPQSDTSAMTVITADGENFSIVYHSDAAGIYAIDYDYKEKNFLVAGAHESTNTDAYAALTADGITSEEVDVTSFSAAIYGVQYNGSQWVAMSDAVGAEIKYSAKGRLWKAATLNGDFSTHWGSRLAKDVRGNLYLFGGDSATANEGKIYRSTDNGKTFQHVLTTDNNPDFFRRGAHGQDYWLAVGESGAVYKSGVALANIFNGALVNASTTSQTLNPIRAHASIGKISFGFVDENLELTALLNHKLKNKQGLRAKRVRHYMGKKGDVWPSGYKLLQTQQIYGAIGWADGAYQFTAQDIQRSTVKEIFDPKRTTLLSTVSLTDDILNVNSTAALPFIQHGSANSDAPNKSVLYVKADKEVIRCTSALSTTTLQVDTESSTLSANVSESDAVIPITDHSAFESVGVGYIVTGSPATRYPIKWTGKSDSPHQLTGVTGVTTNFSSGDTIVNLSGRGALGTQIARHEVDTNQDADKRTKVEEYIFYEMPALQFLYYLLTGTLYNNSPTFTGPSHHTLGITSEWVATSEFINPGFIDLWDPSDDTAGLILRFEGLKKTNAKKFIEEQILRICGLYMPILETGELGLRRMHGVVSDAAYSRVLDEGNVLSITNVRYDLEDIYNEILVNWNYDPLTKVYTRPVLLSDSNSIEVNQTVRQLVIDALGLHGSIHTDAVISNLFNIWRDRHAYHPFKATVNLDYTFRDLRVGDIVKLTNPNVPEFSDQQRQYSELGISVEVQRVHVNHMSGVVSADVFGSTFRSDPLVFGTPTVDDSAFTTHGSDLAAMLTSSPETITGSESGGVLTITGGTLTGVDDINSATALADNNQGRFYYDGDIVLGAEVNITGNVMISCTGTITGFPDGYINGIGGGPAGTATEAGTAAGVGITKPSGGIIVHQSEPITSTERAATQGDMAVVGPFNLVNNNTEIAGIPNDLRGCSGGKGGDAVNYAGTDSSASGGNGGAGGAGLILCARNAIAYPGFRIDLSGEDGSAGGSLRDDYFLNLDSFTRAGSGAGGYPGGLLVIIASTTLSETISTAFIANAGETPLFGERMQTPTADGFSEWITQRWRAYQYIRSYYDGTQAESKVVANLSVHYLTESQTAAPDTPSQATLPSAINVSAHGVTQNAINIYGLEISVTPPASTNYLASRIYIRKQNVEGWQYVGEVQSTTEAVFWAPADGSTYVIKAHSLSISQVESEDYIERTFTVENDITTQIGNMVVNGSQLIVYDNNSPQNAIQTIDLLNSGVMTGTIVGAGDQSNEQLVPNNRFNFVENSPQQPMGWAVTEWNSAYPGNITYVTTDSPDTEGPYLVLPNYGGGSDGYGISSKVFKLIPGRKYRARIRCRAVANSPLDIDGFYFRLQYGAVYADHYGIDGQFNRDGYNDFIDGTSTEITTSWATYEFDYTVPAGAEWGSIALYGWNQSTAEFHVAWVEFIPWGVLQQNTNDYSEDGTFFHIPYWQSVDGIPNSSGFGGSVGVNFGRLFCRLDTSSSSNCSLHVRDQTTWLSDLTWAYSRRFKTVLTWAFLDDESPTVHEFGVTTGAPVDFLTGHCVGFYYHDGSWYAYAHQGVGNTTETSISINSGDTVECVLDRSVSPNEARYYVNDVLVATITTDLPTTADTTYDNYILSIAGNNSGAASSYGQLFIGEFKFLWDS